MSAVAAVAARQMGETDLKEGLLMVAEDDPTNMLVIRKLLERAGYAPITAKDGVEAVEAAVEHRPRVILMDISMPRLDGVSAARQILEELGDNAPAVVAVTANATARQREECLSAGFYDFLTKPVRAKLLLPIVERLLADGNVTSSGGEAGIDHPN